LILNRQRTVPVSLRSLDRFGQRLRQTLDLPEDSLTVCLVSEAEIARWNRAYRGKNGPTDVLSFLGGGERHAGTRSGSRRRSRSRASAEPAPPWAGETDGYLGDIAIAPTVARRNARRLGRGLALELRILMLHGALHLLGYDHERDHGEMDRLERRLRRRLGLAT
jgi:probable rRNA maturation factor